jgi:deoxycytidylate deaminase
MNKKVKSNAKKDALVESSNDMAKFVDTEEALELFFGLVGPTGVDLDLVCDTLSSELRSMDYETEIISLSDLIAKYLGAKPIYSDNYERILSLMKMGTFLKEKTEQPDIVARLAIGSIRALRRRNKNKENFKTGRAYIVRSFKLPAEVELFRELYGEQFVLISVYGSKPSRVEFLKRNIGPTLKSNGTDVHELARQLIKRDYEEENSKNGQQVGKTFPIADYFVNSESRRDLEINVHRLVQLTFGHPYISPTKDEQAMFFAQAAGLRSVDLSRQVGAAIVSSEGEILTTGCNDVARAGGGLYWGDDDNPQRDVEIGYDANVVLKRHILEDVMHRLQEAKWLTDKRAQMSVGDLVKESLISGGGNPGLRKSAFYDVIEFGRAVHAEMSAISQAARSGVRLQDSRLFCTTFPCHICARHIVASGVKEVIFVEPYEKSKVQDLYSDSIAIEPSKPVIGMVAFKAFVGVAPRRYIGFFQSQGSKKLDSGKTLTSEGVSKYKVSKKKTFHIMLLETYIVETTKPAPPYAEEHGAQNA